MSKSHTWQVLHSSADQCWQTPEALYQSLHTEFSFTLDAAAPKGSALVIFRPTPRAGENPSMRAYSYGDK